MKVLDDVGTLQLLIYAVDTELDLMHLTIPFIYFYETYLSFRLCYQSSK